MRAARARRAGRSSLRGCAQPTAESVLLGTCDTELAMPYQPWVHVLDDLVRAMPGRSGRLAVRTSSADVSHLVPRLDRRLPSDERATAAHPGTEQYRLFSAVDAILADAARRWPTLVVIDDLQWASSQSLALLRHLSSRGAASRLLLVGTFRDTADEVTKPLASCLAELRRSPTTSRLRLKGLDQATVEQFVASAVGHELDRELQAVATSLVEHSSGNAL